MSTERGREVKGKSKRRKEGRKGRDEVGKNDDGETEAREEKDRIKEVNGKVQKYEGRNVRVGGL